MRLSDFFGNFFPSHHDDHHSNGRDDFFSGVWGHNGDQLNEDGQRFGSDYNPDYQGHPFGGDDMFSMMERFMRGFSNNMDSVFPNQDFMDGGSSDDARNPHHDRRSLRDQVMKHPESDESECNDYRTPKYDGGADRLPTQHDMDAMMRDFFRRPFFAPFLEKYLPKEDTDLDADVKQGGLDVILSRKGEERREVRPGREVSPFQPHFSMKSESRTMIRRADGSSEQRITRRDADGNSETTIITETPSGERRTEIRKNDGNTEVINSDDETGPRRNGTSPQLRNFDEESSHFNMNSIFKYLFSK